MNEPGRRPVKVHDDAARDAILARLAQTRAEIKHLLEPRPEEDGEPSPDDDEEGFPRSRTMRMLMTGRGLGAVGATLAGLLVARPTLIWRVVRMVPKGALMRILALKVTEALRSRGSSKR
jgi:hypothetical protein